MFEHESAFREMSGCGGLERTNHHLHAGNGPSWALEQIRGSKETDIQLMEQRLGLHE